MGDSSIVVRHASRIIRAVRGEQRTSIAPHVAKSWNRCLTEYGMEPNGARATAVLEANQLRERQQKLGELLGVARAEMESLYDQIAGSGYAVILADADATILSTITDPTLKREFRHAGLWHGALWDEPHEGTNGLGTCVAERRAVTIHRDEHFMGYNLAMSCSGAPIIDANGGLLGVLDASSVNCNDTRVIQRHTMALVNMSANLIARCHFLREFPHAWVLRFHSRPEFVGLLHEALVAVSGEGRILAVNESALTQLGHPDRKILIGTPIEDVFQFQFATLDQRATTAPQAIWPIRDVQHGRRFFALVRAPQSEHGSVVSRPASETVRNAPSVPLGEGARRHVGADPRMQHNFNCAQQLFGKRVPILLQGATGTGKEAFARALHQISPWAGRSFVAVNCGSIPESLIESELFGYTRGAFTDADRHGRPGKILQSSGGTLFLDEIGDMPLTLQTRLLRVIEEYEIVPLGGDTPVPVDLHVISASHRDIRQMVTEGEFREDLYYRLNGTTLHLPMLKDRADAPSSSKCCCTRKIRAVIRSASSPMRCTRCSTTTGRATSASCATCCAPPRLCASTTRSVCRTCPRSCSIAPAKSRACPKRSCRPASPRRLQPRRKAAVAARRSIPRSIPLFCVSSSATAGTSRTRPMRSASAATRCTARFASIRSRSPNSATGWA